MPFILRNGYNIHYYAEGTGETIVFLHSLGACLELWKEQFEEFKKEFRVVALDFKGHGQSDEKIPFTIEDAAEDTIQVMDALRADRVHLVGISMGGHVAMEMHKRIPGRIRTMLLADTWAYMPPEVREERTRIRIGRLHEIGMESFAAELAKNSLASGATAEQVQRLQQLIRCSKETYGSAWHAVHVVDYRGELPGIRVPVCVLVGDEDKSTPLSYAEQIASLIPHAEWEIVPNGGHLSHLTNSMFFNEKIRETIRKSH